MNKKVIGIAAALTVLALALLFFFPRAGVIAPNPTAPDSTATVTVTLPATEPTVTENAATQPVTLTTATTAATSQTTSETTTALTTETTIPTTETTTNTTAVSATTAAATTAAATVTTTATTTETTTATTAAPSTTTTTTTTTATTTTEAANTCTLTVECLSVWDNLGELKEGHEAYLPKDGYYLKDYTCTLQEGDTVYDVLKRAAKKNDLQLTVKKTSFGMYVAGINQLDEFDVGKDKGWTSGWVYYVNGEFASVSSSMHPANAGDEIVFSYSCKADN